MKTFISYVALIAMIVTSSFTIDTQQKLNKLNDSKCLSLIRAHRNAKGIAISWKADNTDISQFIVERSYDGSSFEHVGEVSPGDASDYKLNDPRSAAGKVYYRITAKRSDDRTETSTVELSGKERNS
jgi:hypothetical protein